MQYLLKPEKYRHVNVDFYSFVLNAVIKIVTIYYLLLLQASHIVKVKHE